ncbi:MAG: hypothetical protein AAF206_16230 [Bacteroidota bacterium]
MQRILRTLTPHWLRQLDQQLLINKPVIWASQVHFVLFFSLAAMLLAAVLGFVTSGNLQLIPDMEDRTDFLGIPTVLVLLFWLIRTHQRQAWRATEDRNGSRLQLAILLGSLSIVSVPVVYTVSLQYHIASQISVRELAADEQAYLMGHPYATFSQESLRNVQGVNRHFRTHFSLIPGMLPPFTSQEDRKRLFFAPEQDEAKLAVIEAYLDVLDKYGTRPVEISPQEVLDFHDGKSSRLMVPEYRAGVHIRKLISIKQRPFGSLSFEKVWWTFFFGLTFMLLTYGYFSLVRKRIFLLTGAVLIGLFFGQGVLINIIDSSFKPSASAMILATGILNWIYWRRQAFGRDIGRRKYRAWTQMSVYFFMFATAFLPFCIYFGASGEVFHLDRDMSVVYTIAGGMLLNLIGWPLLVRPRLLALQSAPDK